VDGSAYSKAAAASIASRPWPAGVEIRVLSVVEFYLPTVQALLEPPFIPSSQIPELREEAMKHAQDAVEDAMNVLAPTGAKLSQSISVLLKNPKTVILEEAKQWGADLIVLGPHGRSGMERFLIGSVAESVATHAECSVEVVRRK
jgi:nucleotide-binding universal stress UspA family protein